MATNLLSHYSVCITINMLALLKLFIVAAAFFLPSAHGWSRIIGGQPTDISRRPYQASIQLHVGPLIFHNCGGSIISTKFILTAAHCDPRANLRNAYARVGSTTYLSGGQVLKVDKFTRHPGYDYEILDNDYGIVHFEEGEEIVLGPNVAIIPLASTTNPPDNALLTIAGWGYIKDGAGESEEILREVDLPLMSQDKCRTIYEFVTDRQMCMAGTPLGDINPCFGDSGGAGVYNGVQYAITSGVSVLGCEAPNMPSIYARVTEGRQWITQITGV